MLRSLVGSEMCIRDRVSTQSTGVNRLGMLGRCAVTRFSLRSTRLLCSTPPEARALKAPTIGSGSLADRLKRTIAEYGVVATGLHTTVFFSSWAATHMAIKAGLDVSDAITMIPYVGDMYKPEEHKELGELAASYLTTMSLGPVRTVFTIAAAPALTIALKRRGYAIPRLPGISPAAPASKPA
eukprot:TRINITY_DN43679_c0_g1_i1.p1 TRINITY_DN43679_c0_g1~~TRINITY_DN43679_c0_g1_i1.p1  ORF type:complete len:183 (+),score=44.67 TRINITY_DN43679_c0_g1_i1:92-640(+)